MGTCQHWPLSTSCCSNTGQAFAVLTLNTHSAMDAAPDPTCMLPPAIKGHPQPQLAARPLVQVPPVQLYNRPPAGCCSLIRPPSPTRQQTSGWPRGMTPSATHPGMHSTCCCQRHHAHTAWTTLHTRQPAWLLAAVNPPYTPLSAPPCCPRLPPCYCYHGTPPTTTCVRPPLPPAARLRPACCTPWCV